MPLSPNVKRLATPDKFIEHGTQLELYRECGIDDIAVVEAVKEMLSTSLKASTERLRERDEVRLRQGYGG